MNADVADAFEAGAWEFTPDVVAEFDKHVRQSVPFYDVIQDAVAELSDWLAPHDSTIVDLGCSTGTTLQRICTRHPDRAFRMWGYDTSDEMLVAAKEKLGGTASFAGQNRSIVDGLIHQDANLTLCLFTLQFIHPRDRVTALACARQASRGDAAIIIAEKVRVPDGRWGEIAAEVSWDIKAESGIPSESIRAKARALRGVLIPNTVEQNFADLHAAGWVNPSTLFRWHQWTLYGAFAS